MTDWLSEWKIEKEWKINIFSIETCLVGQTNFMTYILIIYGKQQKNVSDRRTDRWTNTSPKKTAFNPIAIKCCCSELTLDCVFYNGGSG